MVESRLTLGDPVLINTFLIQLCIPLSLPGVMYREIKRGLTDLDKMFGPLQRHRELDDPRCAQPLQVQSGVVRVENLGFA